MKIAHNSFPLSQAPLGAQGLRGVGFASFSFSATLFSSGALNGLNHAWGCHPQSPPLNTLGSLFTCISLLQVFGNLQGTGSNPGCVPQFPTPPQHPTDPCPPTPRPAPLKRGQMWDVFFDTKSGTKTQQHSPIVLDLNGNGRPDITGSNIKGNGKLEGKTVKGFDLNPQNRQWETKSVNRRPGDGAPDLPKGTKVQVFDKNGKLVKTLTADQLEALHKKNKAGWDANGGDMGLGLSKGMHAEFRDANGRLVSELKQDGTNNNKFLYFWGNKNENEWTKAWDKKKGGDGMLVWDTDGDGKITSGKELFGHVDLNGKNTFKNGYEKLAHYFDKDGDGVVKGSELKGLKIWEDRNGDGITQKGELVELAKHGVRELNTRFNAANMGSTFGYTPPGQATAQPASTPPAPSVPTAPSLPPMPSLPPFQIAMQQTWQIFQMVEVMRQMQMTGFGLA